MASYVKREGRVAVCISSLILIAERERENCHTFILSMKGCGGESLVWKSV